MIERAVSHLIDNVLPAAADCFVAEQQLDPPRRLAPDPRHPRLLRHPRRPPLHEALADPHFQARGLFNGGVEVPGGGELTAIPVPIARGVR